MAEQSTFGEKLLIYGEYPHSLMQHILTLLRVEKKGTEWLLTEEFFQKYSEKNSAFTQEIKELQIAKKRGLLKGFSDHQRSGEKEKKSFIRDSLLGLLEELREFEAAELLESLMWVFGWEISVEVIRKWDVSEQDKANFHNFDELEMFERNTNPSKEEEIPEAPAVEEARIPETGTVRSGETREEKVAENENQEVEKTVPVKEKREIQPAEPKDTPEQRKEKIQMILNMSFMEETEYKKILKEIRIPYEHLMHLSLRNEIRRAKRGNDLSQTSLADFYAEENTEHTDFFSAAIWYSFAARQGNDKAKLELARILDGEKLSTAKGKRIISTKRHGMLYFKELAEKGYPTAQSILGMKYCFGDGVRKNAAKGISWLKKAAEQGQIDAQRQLGDLYADVDEEQSKKWFRLAHSGGEASEGGKQ